MMTRSTLKWVYKMYRLNWHGSFSNDQNETISKSQQLKGEILIIYLISIDMKQNIVFMFDKISYYSIFTKLMNNL